MSRIIPDLVDVFVPEGEAYVWVQLVPDCNDLQLERCGEEAWGELRYPPAPPPEEPEALEPYWKVLREGFDPECPPSPEPEWFEWEVSNGGIETFIGPAWKHPDDGDLMAPATWAAWALEEGIAPEQPFLLRIGIPRYSRDYYGECDVDYEYNIERTLPLSSQEAFERWTKFFNEVRDDRAALLKQRAKLKELARTDLDALFLRRDVYFSGPSTYDDMAMPNGVSVVLYSSHGQWTQLASGRDDDGEFKTAMDQLVAEVAKRYPHIPEDFVRHLPYRS